MPDQNLFFEKKRLSNVVKQIQQSENGGYKKQLPTLRKVGEHKRGGQPANRMDGWEKKS